MRILGSTTASAMVKLCNSTLFFVGIAGCKRNYASSSARKAILALDFDGVLCDSAMESATTAVAAARCIWPRSADNKISVGLDARIVDMLREVRPIIETGYELVVVAKYLQDAINAGGNEESATWKAETEAVLLTNWDPNFRDALMKQYESSKTVLTSAFSAARDSRIQTDPKAWLNSNSLYHGIHNTLSSVDINKVAIVTTKHERFARAILNHQQQLSLYNGGCSNASPQTDPSALQSNIFDLENRYGNKIHVLQELTRRHQRQDTSVCPEIHFVEDRYETLLSVLRHRRGLNKLDAASQSLHNVRLYLADWGYNTPAQRQAAREEPEIEVIDRKQFHELAQRIAGVFSAAEQRSSRLF